MAGVPSHIDLRAVEAFLGALPEVTQVHDLHIWPVSTTEVALTAHLVLPWPSVPPAFLATVGGELEKRFGIHHITIQLEGDGAHPCAQADASVL